MAAEVSGLQFDEAAVQELSQSVGDPAEFGAVRRQAFERYRELPLEPNPLYRQYGYFAGVELGGIDPRVRGPPVSVPPPAPWTIQAIHHAGGTTLRMGTSASGSSAVHLTPMAEIWKEPGDRVREFAGVPPTWSDQLGALSVAVLNRAYRLEVSGATPSPVRLQDVTVLSRPHEALGVRRRISLGPHAQLTMSEEAYSAGGEDGAQRLLSSSTTVDLAEEAQATALVLHAPDPKVVGIYHRNATVGPRGRVTWIWSGFGGFRTKLRNLTELNGNGSSVEDLQTFFGDGEQSYDSGVQITHRGTDTNGHSATRGVFRDQARGMSRGLVRIEADARKTLSYLSEHAMLLSRGARSDTIPVLEILCRDVKATHSSSVAPVDPEKIFYLESRGFEEQESVRMIAEGFLSQVLERAPIPELREILYPYLSTRWDHQPIAGSAERLPLLPDLSTGSEGADRDWRFDSKLR